MFLLLVLYLDVNAIAQNNPKVDTCQETNLVQKQNSPFNQIPVYDQDGAGICFAYTAAQMIDYYRVSRGLKPESHPLWVALLSKETMLSSGYAVDAINDMRTYGSLCKKQIVTELLDALRSSSKLTDPELLHTVEWLYRRRSQYDFLDSTDVFPKLSAHLKKSLSVTCTPNDLETIFGPIWDDILVLEELSSPAIAFSDTLTSCYQKENQVPVEVPAAKLFAPKPLDPKQFEKKIHSVLHENALPLGISFCSNIVKVGKGFRGIMNSQRLTSCNRHAALIVGQKRGAGNKCQYLVRNSWGIDWRANKKWTCDCTDVSGKEYGLCDSKPGLIQNAGCWVDSDELLANTYGLTHFEVNSTGGHP